ncbi:MAE_28990/MAE_18760 family HEPN-like nuclease [Oceanimonas sp. AH20CE76]|uniref:MAE_28990/MAE_18760 family HEPN-like nuclease n=1 Tax=Oceanimonas sp. AH20CE76 TaxID=2977120 RepID=UPI0031FE68AB
MKIRCLQELDDTLDEDLAWRKREFTTLKFLVERLRNHERNIVIRGAIPLLYSHWEGHVKLAAEAYLVYLKSKGISYDKLKDNFVHIGIAAECGKDFSIHKYESQKSLHDFIVSGLQKNFAVDEKKVVDTESNLKSGVLFKILQRLGLDTSKFELKDNFIDEVMLQHRNKVAHGERCDTETLFRVYEELQDELIKMISTFHNMIKNAASNQEYLKAQLFK